MMFFVVALREALAESYPAVAGSVPCARQAVGGYAAHQAGLRGAALDAVKVAVSEAVTNAVRHAYRGGVSGAVHVTATVADDDLWVLVADDGCGYRSPAATPGLGCGLAVIAANSKDYTLIERAEGGTEVRMRFATAGEAG